MQLTSTAISDMKALRRAARTDLLVLCRDLLGYNDVDPIVHAPYLRLADVLKDVPQGIDIITPKGEYCYIPHEETLSVAVPRDVLRRYLILGFRSSLKTTINTTAHTIQIILNFPHIAGAIYHNTEENANIILGEIVDHFSKNQRMREVFPEFCIPPADDIKKWHKKLEFTTPARFLGNTSLLPYKKEPTVSALGLGTSQAGRHFQFMKLTDVVEATNSQSPDARKKVSKGIAMVDNLLEDDSCFFFMEGTPYHPEDDYSIKVQEEWFKTKKSSREWVMIYHPAYEIDNPSGERTYTPDEMSMPFKKAKSDIFWPSGSVTRKGERIPVWPVWRKDQRKWDNQALARKEREDSYIFACQQLLRPSAADTAIFPPEKCFNIFPAREVEDLNIQLRVMTIDTASSTDPDYSNDTAITCGIVTDSLLRVVVQGTVGLYDDKEIVDLMFEFNKSFKPDIILIEDTMFVQGLKGHWRLEEEKRNIQLPIGDLVKRPKNMNKKVRIRGAIKTPLSIGRLKFSSALSSDYLERVKMEMSGFPTAAQDDVLDTLEMLCTASADMATYDSDRAKVRRLMEEEQARLREEANAYSKWLTGQDFPDQIEGETLVTNLGM